MCKISGCSTLQGPKYGIPKSRFSGYNCTSKSTWLVDQSSANFFVDCRRKRCRALSFQILDISILSEYNYFSCSKWEGVRNHDKFSMFFAPNIFLGQTPKFLDRHLKLNMLPTAWQNFAAIGQGTSKISQ